MFFIISSLLAIWTAQYVLEISMRKTFLHEKELIEKNAEITQQKEELKTQRDHEKQQKEQIAEQNKQITASIRYAQRLQNALLPKKEFLKNYFENFLIYLPRDIVSGDFYWFRKFKKDIFAIAAADCTGHGVPGAFVSMLGISLIQEFFKENLLSSPHIVLNLARKRIKMVFSQTISDTQQDGMDIALAVIDKINNKLYFSGANRPIYICRKNNNFSTDDINYRTNNFDEKTIIEIKPDRMPVGVFVRELSFTTKTFDLLPNDLIYLFSDGYIDQFNENKSQMKSSELKKLLCQISNFNFNEQKEILLNDFNKRKGKHSQTDDVLFIGLKYL
jgi:serine phosphatase RsbU (regulator of sigma subunit)